MNQPSEDRPEAVDFRLLQEIQDLVLVDQGIRVHQAIGFDVSRKNVPFKTMNVLVCPSDTRLR